MEISYIKTTFLLYINHNCTFMKKNLLYLIFFLSTFANASVITGSVLLDNSSDHSGITIKFAPISPSAVYGGTTSNSDGTFNATIENGIYDVTFEKEGYQTYTLSDQFIAENTTLPSVVLNSNSIVNIGIIGLFPTNVSGVWTSNNTYIVNGNIKVPSGATLTIEPGTLIKFSGYYSVLVNGTLNAIGTEENYIRFTSQNSNPTNTDWNSININSSSNSTILKYCIIEYGKEENSENKGIVNIEAEATIENCIIRHSDEKGISIGNDATNVNILNNEISDCDRGVFFNDSTNPIAIIDGNRIYDNGVGIFTGWANYQTVVRNNIISDCINGISTYTSITIHNNIIFDSTKGISVNGNQPTIRNNTIFSNLKGVSIDNSDAFNPNPIINSNIIINNSVSGIISEGTPVPNSVTYNLLYNNGNDVSNLPIGIGTIVTTNDNGTPSDTYYNIFSSADLISMDPLNPDICKLNNSSSAINAGDPDIENIYNSTIIDIGAKESSETLSINDLLENNVSIFPNPISDHLNIKASKNQQFNKIILYSLNGKMINEFTLENLTSEYTIENLDNLNSGIYFLGLFNNNFELNTIKLLKK